MKAPKIVINEKGRFGFQWPDVQGIQGDFETYSDAWHEIMLIQIRKAAAASTPSDITNDKHSFIKAWRRTAGRRTQDSGRRIGRCSRQHISHPC